MPGSGATLEGRTLADAQRDLRHVKVQRILEWTINRRDVFDLELSIGAVSATDESYMREALREAQQSLKSGDVPIGSLLVHDDKIVARAHWSWAERDLLAHPELLVLRSALSRRATLYSTLEPCVMCMGAAMSGFVARVVFALESPTDGAARIPAIYREHQTSAGAPWSIPEVVGGILRTASHELIQRFLLTAEPGPIADWARTLRIQL